MKQKDIALIIVVAFISAMLSFFVSNKIFVTPKNRQQRVEVVDKITAEFKEPDKRFINPESINPILNTPLEPGTNQNPFNGSGR